MLLKFIFRILIYQENMVIKAIYLTSNELVNNWELQNHLSSLPLSFMLRNQCSER
jgi:hypothetical protein